MDIIKEKRKNFFSKNKKQLFLVGTVITFGLIAVLYRSDSVLVSRDDILVEVVKQGNIDVKIDGYGSLRSDKQQLLSSLTRATVKEILLKPGAKVSENSIILILENSELQQEVDNVQQEVVQYKANLRQLKLSQKREILDEALRLEEASSNHRKAKVKRDAYSRLKDRGVIAGVDYQEVVLDEELWGRRHEILFQRNAQLKLVHKEVVTIEVERIKQQEGLLNIAKSRLDSLIVRAGIDGVLQRLSVELGQSLDIGQEIALIGSVKDLFAIIKVPQSQAQKIVIGQKVIVSTRSEKIIGKVSRIDPIVQENTVNVEVVLPKNLPESARPQLNIDAVIVANTIEQVTYIKRPVNVREKSETKLYKLDKKQKHGLLHVVRLGRRAGDYIEILSGANENDYFVISDLSGISKNSPSITIK